MPTGSSDGELLRAAQSGDQDAWRELVRRVTPRMFGVARSMRLTRHDAADVSQVALLRLWSHIAEIRDPERVGSWLATTVRNECLRHIRTSGRQIPVSGDDDDFETDTGGQPDVDTALLRTEREGALWRALSALPARCQGILRLLSTDPPPSYEEVAAALDIPVGSIGPTRGRCLRMLRNRLAG